MTTKTYVGWPLFYEKRAQTTEAPSLQEAANILGARFLRSLGMWANRIVVQEDRNPKVFTVWRVEFKVESALQEVHPIKKNKNKNSPSYGSIGLRKIYRVTKSEDHLVYAETKEQAEGLIREFCHDDPDFTAVLWDGQPPPGWDHTTLVYQESIPPMTVKQAMEEMDKLEGLDQPNEEKNE